MRTPAKSSRQYISCPSYPDFIPDLVIHNLPQDFASIIQTATQASDPYNKPHQCTLERRLQHLIYVVTIHQLILLQESVLMSPVLTCQHHTRLPIHDERLALHSNLLLPIKLSLHTATPHTPLITLQAGLIPTPSLICLEVGSNISVDRKRAAYGMK